MSRIIDILLQNGSTAPRKVSWPESRRNFRRSLEELIDSNDQLVRYVASFSAYDNMNDSRTRKLASDFIHVVEEARRLDLEIRDFLQLNVSNASLEESKKSIGLANVQSLQAKAQIEESKRGTMA